MGDARQWRKDILQVPLRHRTLNRGVLRWRRLPSSRHCTCIGSCSFGGICGLPDEIRRGDGGSVDGGDKCMQARAEDRGVETFSARRPRGRAASGSRRTSAEAYPTIRISPAILWDCSSDHLRSKTMSLNAQPARMWAEATASSWSSKSPSADMLRRTEPRRAGDATVAGGLDIPRSTLGYYFHMNDKFFLTGPRMHALTFSPAVTMACGI